MEDTAVVTENRTEPIAVAPITEINEIPLTLEGLREFSRQHYNQRVDKDGEIKNEKLAKDFSERSWGRAGEFVVDIQFSSEDADNTVTVNESEDNFGTKESIAAKVWLTKKDDKSGEYSAWCFQLTKSGKWVLEKTREKPNYVAKEDTDYWKVKDAKVVTDPLEFFAMRSFLMDAQKKPANTTAPKQ